MRLQVALVSEMSEGRCKTTEGCGQVERDRTGRTGREKELHETKDGK